MKCIVALGNPGSNYEKTRHNAGFIILDHIISEHAIGSVWKKNNAPKYAYMTIKLFGQSVVVCKPLTYMNLSGEAVQSICTKYKIIADDIIVLHDELDIGLGRIVHKIGGGSAGHNGLKSISAHIGPDFQRIRIGINRPDPGYDVVSHVLGQFSVEDLAALLSSCADIEKILENFLEKE